MRNHPLKTFALTAALAVGGWSGVASGAQLEEILSAANDIHDQARQSQQRIDELSDETRQLLSEYKTVVKEVEGLRVYNSQLQRQIDRQEQEMADLNDSIERVTLIERQITPLMLRMIDGLEQFVELDVPFLVEERVDRIERLREVMDRADVSVSEKFGQILNAYEIETEYGRTMEAYTDSLEVGDRELVVDFLRFGRIALLAQTTDGEVTRAWDQNDRQWVTVDDSYNTSVRQAIRMARQQASVNLVTLPIPGAEQAEQ